MKYILAAAMTVLCAGGAYAGNAFGDGSPANTFVLSQNYYQSTHTDARHAQMMPVTHDYWGRRLYRGDGSVSNSYVVGAGPNIARDHGTMPGFLASQFGGGSNGAH